MAKYVMYLKYKYVLNNNIHWKSSNYFLEQKRIVQLGYTIKENIVNQFEWMFEIKYFNIFTKT